MKDAPTLIGCEERVLNQKTPTSAMIAKKTANRTRLRIEAERKGQRRELANWVDEIRNGVGRQASVRWTGKYGGTVRVSCTTAVDFDSHTSQRLAEMVDIFEQIHRGVGKSPPGI